MREQRQPAPGKDTEDSAAYAPAGEPSMAHAPWELCEGLTVRMCADADRDVT